MTNDLCNFSCGGVKLTVEVNKKDVMDGVKFV
jgi:hypothetical protein